MTYVEPVMSGQVIEPWNARFANEIAPKLTSWRNARSRVVEQMMRVQERYDGTWVLPDLGTDATPLTPTYMNDVIDGLADRANSVDPRTMCPPLDPSKIGGGRGSQDYATRRRQAIGYAHFESDWKLGRGRAFRHLVGYANTSLVVIPDMRLQFPRLVVRDPLHALPEPKAPEDLTPPSACAWVYGKSRQWIAKVYPEAREHLGKEPALHDADALWDLVEYVDEDSIYVGLLGPRGELSFRGTGADRLQPLCLRRWDNLAGRCTGVMAEGITLSRIASQLSHLTGHADLIAKLTALDIMATEQSLLPDKYIIGAQNKTPILVGGTWHRGVTGKTNLLADTAAVGQFSAAPDPNNKATQDRLENAFMRSSGAVGPMAGQTSGMAGQLRTGRGIDALLGASVDPRIATLQDVMSARLRWANEIIIDTYKGYWGRKKYQVFSGWPTDQGMVEFTPDVHLETTANVVSYPIPGADAQNLTVALGGLVATGLISIDTARELHPWISNPEGEAAKGVRETLRQFMLDALGAQSQDPQGGLTHIDLADIDQELGRNGGDLAKAIQFAQRRAQERQATLAPPAAEGQIAAPEAMPGLALPGQGAEQPAFETPPVVEAVAPAVDNLRRINSALIGSAVPRR